MEKRKNITRLLSLALCLIMLVGIMPVNAFAAKAMATTISSVGVTGIEEPVYGERPDTTGKVEHSGVYEIENIRWKQQYSDKFLSGSSSFSAGTVYEVHITLKATGSYRFARLQNGTNNVEASINGEDANVTRAADAEDNTKYIDIVMSFPATEDIDYIDEVSVDNLEEPEAGKWPSFEADTPNGSGYYVSDIRWVKAGNSQELSSSDKFEYNQKYYAFVDLKARDGYQFSAYNYMEGEINGVEAGFNSSSNSSTVTMFAPFVSTGMPVVSGIAIDGVTAPQGGKSPDYSITFKSSGVQMTAENDEETKNGISWYTGSGRYRTDVPVNGFFGADTEYVFEIFVEAADGYQFSTDSSGYINATATVNGKTTYVMKTKSSTEAIITYAFPKTGNIALSKVTVTDIDTPVANESPDYVASYGNVNYGAAAINNATTKNGISWYNETDGKTIATNTKFEAGKVYTVQVAITPKDGYEFDYSGGDYNVSGWVNGTGKAELMGRDESEIILCYTFPELKHAHSPMKVDEVKATCTEKGKKSYYFCPECGKNFEDEKCTKEIKNINSWGDTPVIDHSGGKADCQTKAKCSMCGKEYGKLGDHKWGTTWGYTTTSGHAHVCTVNGCDAHDTVVKHTPGPEATESNSQKCTVCGFIIKPAKPHTHKMVRMSAVDATCDKEGVKQHFICSICDLISSDSKGTKEITSKDELIIPATGHKESKWKTDADSHWKECTVKSCGAVIEDTKQAHELDADGKCSVCGYNSKKGAVSSKDPADPSGNTAAPEKPETSEKPEAENTNAAVEKESGGVSMSTVIIVAVVVAAAAVGGTLLVVKKKQ